tara:strand:+ start:80 stop:364 length:285 start_codon:yes stop_codon:yes gene_type:complete
VNISAVVLAHGHPETSNFLAVLASGGTCALLELLVVLGILEVSGFFEVLGVLDIWGVFGEYPLPQPCLENQEGSTGIFKWGPFTSENENTTRIR